MPVSISGAGSISGLDQGFNVTTGSVGVGTTNPRTDLQVGAFGGGNSNIQLATGTSGASNILFGDGSGGSDYYKGFIKYNHSTDNLELYTTNDIIHYTGGSERLRIESGGGLKFTGQGTSIPIGGILHHTNNNLYVRGGTSGLVLGNQDNTNTIHISESDYIRFETTDGTERLRIDSSGNLLLKTGEIDIQGGNKTVKTSAGFLQVGTSGSHYLSLITAGSQRLNITSGGQVNIGGDLTQTGFTASITRNSSETDILRIKGNGGNAFIRFEDNDASSSFTLGADDAVGSNGFALYDRSDSAYRVVVDTDGRVCINATSPATIGGQTPYLYVASTYTNLDGLRIRGLDTGNTLWKTGGDMSLTVASNDAINLKTNGTTRFVLNANSNNSTTLSIGNGNNLTNNTSPDRTSVKVGGTLHLEASFAGQNHRTGMYYNCYASGQNNFYQGTFGANSFDYRAAAATMRGGAFQVYTDPGTSTNYSAGAQITTMKETLTCTNGFVKAPNQPCFWATSNTGGSHTSNGYTGIISNQFEAAYVNVGNHFSTSTGVFTCPVAGTYEFHGQGLIRYQGSAGRAELSFYKNGSNTVTRSYGYTYITGSSDHDNLHVMAYITCAANDQIDLRVYAMDSGIDCYWAQGLGYFAGRLVQ